MSKNSFSNELQRALARPDIEELQQSLSIYKEWAGSNSEDFPDELEPWFDCGEDFDRGLALVMLAAATYDDPKFLCLVSAGLLEDLIAGMKPISIQNRDRIVAEARKTPRFRWMLSAVWTMSASPETREVFANAIGKVSCEFDPLPPRPFP